MWQLHHYIKEKEKREGPRCVCSVALPFPLFLGSSQEVSSQVGNGRQEALGWEMALAENLTFCPLVPPLSCASVERKKKIRVARKRKCPSKFLLLTDPTPPSRVFPFTLLYFFPLSISFLLQYSSY